MVSYSVMIIAVFFRIWGSFSLWKPVFEALTLDKEEAHEKHSLLEVVASLPPAEWVVFCLLGRLGSKEGPSQSQMQMSEGTETPQQLMIHQSSSFSGGV